MPFYIYKNNEQTGPHDDAVVEDGLRTGKFSPLDLASRDGATGWESLSTFFPFISQSRSTSSSPTPPASQASSVEPPSYSPPPYAWAQDSQSSAATNQPYQPQPPGTQQPSAPPTGQAYQQQVAPPLINQFPGAPSANSPLPMTGMVLGIVTMCLMLVGLVPCLGWVNWLMISVGSIAVIVAFIAVVMEKNDKARNKAIIGLSLSLIALFIGTIRLVIGGGCI
jgi:hypothetical protein